MKKPILLVLFIVFAFNSIAQESVKQTDWSSMKMNYIFSRLNTETIINKTLYDGGLHVKIFSISDSRITPENFSDGSDEFLESLLVSISTDGDAYSGSKLFKIEGLEFPKVLNISGLNYPEVILTIEQGTKHKRSQNVFSLNGIN